MDVIFEPLQYGFIQRALIVSLIIGIICPLVGIFVVTRGYGFLGDAVAHAALPGLVGAVIAGVNSWVGMLPSAFGASILISYLTRRTGILADTSIAIVFAALFSIGVLMISIFSESVNVGIEDILLGQILGVSTSDIFWAAGAAVVTVFLLALFFHKLMFASFDPIGAEISGIKTERLDYILLALIAGVVMVAVQAVGVILAVAMVVTPTAAALILARRIHWIMAISVLCGVVSTVSGLYFAYYFNLPTGPLMALVATGIFGIAIIISQRKPRHTMGGV